MVSIACTVDGENLYVAEGAIARSKLVASLPEPVATIDAPFQRSSVAAWQSFAEGGTQDTFLGCISALKVADFLKDEQTVATAAARANQVLFPRVKEPSRVSQEDEEALLALPQHLSTPILQSWPSKDAAGNLRQLRPSIDAADRCSCILSALSPSCHPLTLPRCFKTSDALCVTDRSKLPLESIIAMVPALAPTLRKLEVDGWDGVQPGTEGEFEKLLSPMTYLERLAFDGCRFPWVPSSLTAITSLSVHSDCYEACNCSHEYNFFHCSHLSNSNVTALRALDIFCYVPDFDALAAWLSKLSGLTRFQFEYTDIEDAEAASLASSVSACTRLQHLSLRFLSDGDAVSDEAAVRLQQSVTALHGLTHLTFQTNPSMPCEEQLAVMLQSLPLLQHLDVEGVLDEDGEEGTELSSDALKTALGNLSHLQKVEGLEYEPGGSSSVTLGKHGRE